MPPEGNGHQGEFTRDNRYFVGTDEDFAPYALTSRNVTDNAALTYLAITASDGLQRRDLLLPICEVLRPIPAIAWVPMSIMLWPNNEASIVFITFLGRLYSPMRELSRLSATLFSAAAGAERLVLSTQQSSVVAHGLYERLGFRRLPERDWSPVPGIELLGFMLPLR